MASQNEGHVFFIFLFLVLIFGDFYWNVIMVCGLVVRGRISESVFGACVLKNDIIKF